VRDTNLIDILPDNLTGLSIFFRKFQRNFFDRRNISVTLLQKQWVMGFPVAFDVPILAKTGQI
jgi:hypothetical protein